MRGKWSYSELLLARAVGASVAGREAPEIPVHLSDWNALVAAARFHGLQSWLYSYLKKNDLIKRLPPETNDDLRSEFLDNAKRSLVMTTGFADVARRLVENGIEFIVIKGAALRELVYDEPDERRLGDIDLIMRGSQIGDAGRVFTDAGYSRREMSFLRGPLMCDIHKGIANIVKTVPTPRHFIGIPDGWFWANTRPLGRYGALSLSPICEFILESLHYSLEHGFERLCWGLDLLLILKKFGHEIDPENFIDTVRGHGIGKFMFFVLDYLNEIFEAGGLEIGMPGKCRTVKDLAESLRGLVAGREMKMFERYKRRSVSREERYAFIWMTCGSWSLRSRLMRRILFPSRKFIRGYYKLDRNPGIIDYIRHLRNVIRKASGRR